MKAAFRFTFWTAKLSGNLIGKAGLVEINILLVITLDKNILTEQNIHFVPFIRFLSKRHAKQCTCSIKYDK